LREGIQSHIDQTQTQIERIEQAMEKLEVRPGRKVCAAVAGMQRIEHYEIAAYGTKVALATALGE
jgi:ferritin-like metal-binding protein YciE